MTDFDVVVVGSLNLDMVATAERLPLPGETVHGSTYAEHPGGKGLNQAVAAARAGATVAIVGAIGDDAAGRMLRAVVLAEGIDDSSLRTIDGTPTGRALISVDQHGENSIVIIAGANGRLEIDGAGLPVGRIVLAQLEVPMECIATAFMRGREIGSTTMLNPAPAAELDHVVLDNCDILIPNEHELALLGGAHVVGAGPGSVVVTRGAAGVDLLTEFGSITTPAFAVDAIDTTGAGDAFCGALAARISTGETLESSIRFAAAAGALATTVGGAVPSLPRREAILALVAGLSSRP